MISFLQISRWGNLSPRWCSMSRYPWNFATLRELYCRNYYYCITQVFSTRLLIVVRYPRGINGCRCTAASTQIKRFSTSEKSWSNERTNEYDCNSRPVSISTRYIKAEKLTSLSFDGHNSASKTRE